MKPFHIFLILCTAAIWGFNFVAMRVALEVFSAEQMALARSAITLAVLLPWWNPLARISWRLLAAALAIGTLSFYLLYEAIRVTESLTTVALGTQLMPALSAMLALLFYRERITGRQWSGISVATIGALYLAGATVSHLSVAALGLTVLSVFFYSVGSVVIGKSASVGIWRMLAWIAALSLPPLLFLTISTGPLWPAWREVEPQHWLALLFAVLLSGLLGQAVLLKLYRIYPVAEVVPWTLFIPVFAGLFAVLVYHESITLTLLLGAAVILSGVWIQQSGNRRVRQESSPH